MSAPYDLRLRPGGQAGTGSCPVDHDRWGVPASMCGIHDEDFYGLVGRIALIAALLEDRLHVLYCSLAQVPQETRSGESGSALVKLCQARVERFPHEQQDKAVEVLRAASAALSRRHEVVHSLWPGSAESEGRGWRPARRPPEGRAPVHWTTLTAADLPTLVRELVQVVQDVRALEPWVPYSAQS